MFADRGLRICISALCFSKQSDNVIWLSALRSVNGVTACCCLHPLGDGVEELPCCPVRCSLAHRSLGRVFCGVCGLCSQYLLGCRSRHWVSQDTRHILPWEMEKGSPYSFLRERVHCDLLKRLIGDSDISLPAVTEESFWKLLNRN